MITTAIRIDDLRWQEWLEPVAATTRLRNIECDATLFTNEPNFSKSLAKAGIACVHARDILPPETASFLANADDDKDFNDLKKSLVNSMLAAEAEQTTHFSLQLRLDDPQPDNEARIRKNAAFLKKILLVPLENPFRLDIQIRAPWHFPKSNEWSRAIQICKTADSRRIGLNLQFHPNEYDEQPDPNQLLDEAAPFLHAIAFHYAPRLGDTLFDDELADWAEALKQRKFNGIVAFCPHATKDEDLVQICNTATNWSDFFTD